MASARDRLEGLRLARRLEDRAPLSIGHHLVGVAVEDQDGRAHPADGPEGVVARPEEPARARQGGMRHGLDGRERRLEDQRRGRLLRGQRDGDRGAQRGAEVDDRSVAPRPEPAAHGAGVGVGAGLAGHSRAPAVPAVVEDQDRETEAVVERPELREPVRDVPGVAVAVEQGRGPGARKVPAVDPDAVRGRHLHILERQAERSGSSLERRRGMIDEAPLERGATARQERQRRDEGGPHDARRSSQAAPGPASWDARMCEAW